MINYVEKGSGLHEKIQAEGHWLMQMDGIWKSSNDEVVQSIIDSYNPLIKLKKEKHDQIQVHRELLKNSGYLVQGYRFHSDRDSRIQQLGLVMMGNNIPPGLMWKTLSGEFVEMTPGLAMSIFQTTAGNDAVLHGYGEQRRSQLANLQTVQEVEDFDVTAGWPVV